MFKFANPNALFLYILLLVVVGIYFVACRRRKKALASYGSPELLGAMMPEVSAHRPALKFWITFVALCFMVLVLARPQFGSKAETVTRQGIETVIALDISNSMLAEDVAPSRLEKSKNVISKLVDSFTDDKVGLIVFAGDAFIQLPITSDFISAKIFLESITPDLIARQGTNIKAAIDMATRSFTPKEEVGKAIIIITDGENHEGGAKEAAKAAAKSAAGVSGMVTRKRRALERLDAARERGISMADVVAAGPGLTLNDVLDALDRKPLPLPKLAALEKALAGIEGGDQSAPPSRKRGRKVTADDG